MKTVRLTGAAAIAPLLFMFQLGFSATADARITRLEITAKRSYGTFRPGEFLFWEGRVVGELPPSEQIPDIEKAPRNTSGLIDTRQKSL